MVTNGLEIDGAKTTPHDFTKEQPVRGDLTPVLCILSNELVCWLIYEESEAIYTSRSRRQLRQIYDVFG